MSDSLPPLELQHAKFPCPSSSPRVCSNSCTLSQWCHPTVSPPCHPRLLVHSIFPSIRVFFNESVLCIRWPKYWSFSFGIRSSNEYSGLISFRIDWFDLLAVQGTQESSLAPQFESINSLALSLLYGPTLSLLKLDKHLKMFSVFIETVIIMLTFLLSFLLDHELFRKRPGNVFLISFLGLCRW